MAKISVLRPAKRWRLKSVSGWKLPSLSAHVSAEQVAGQELAYLAWACGEPSCLHSSNYVYSSSERKALRGRLKGVEEVEARMDEQRDSLYRRALDACQRAADALVWRGFGVYVCLGSTCRRVDSVETCFNCDGAGRTCGEECCICNGLGVWVKTSYPAQACMSHGAGYFTDGVRFVYVGTERARGWLAQQRQPIQIIISPGRDPGESEIAGMLDEALGEQIELQLAA